MVKSPRLTPEALEEASVKTAAKQAEVDAQVEAEEKEEVKSSVTVRKAAVVKEDKLTEEDIEWMFNGGLVSIGLYLPEAKDTFKVLCKQERVRIIAPYELRETASVNIPKVVIINGLKFTIPKNTYVELPASVARRVMESQDTKGMDGIINSEGEPLNINSADKAKRWFGL
ncbi:MAG: hypothetical protein RBT33_03890 [Candidatus Dojkabacteria bacterium]|jgi:hypothetical protein|nr:hypothetical protein [Candidatus Dojkabacteria bacterium]